MRLSDWLVTRCCWWLAIIRNHTKKYFGDRLPVANCSECFDASFQSRREMWPEEFAAYSWDRWMRRNLLFFGRKCGVLCRPSSSERRHLFLPAPQTCTECENVLERCARRICSKICQPALTKTKYLRPIKGVSKVSNHATMGSISVVVSKADVFRVDYFEAWTAWIVPSWLVTTIRDVVSEPRMVQDFVWMGSCLKLKWSINHWTYLYVAWCGCYVCVRPFHAVRAMPTWHKVLSCTNRWPWWLICRGSSGDLRCIYPKWSAM